MLSIDKREGGKSFVKRTDLEVYFTAGFVNKVLCLSSNEAALFALLF